MFFIYLVIIGLLGALAPIQTSANSKAQEYLKSPLVSSLFSFLTGTIALIVICLIAHQGIASDLSGTSRLPWWAWCGGAAGVIGITANILLFPRLGSMQTVLMPMVGQIIMGFFIDSFGLFDSPAYPVSIVRFLGFVIVMVGIFYAVSHKGKHFKRKDTLIWQIFGNFSGAFLAMQPAMNSKLAAGLGSATDASLVSFASGTLLLVLLSLSLKGHRKHVAGIFTEKRPFWTWTGGLMGVLIVVGQTFLVQKVGVGLLTILNIFGMLVCSILIDNYGLLGAEKRHVTPKKMAGLALVLGGIILLNI